jgi:hypothetical protein
MIIVVVDYVAGIGDQGKGGHREMTPAVDNPIANSPLCSLNGARTLPTMIEEKKR